jgi:hypothetical protein
MGFAGCAAVTPVASVEEYMRACLPYTHSRVPAAPLAMSVAVQICCVTHQQEEERELVVAMAMHAR